MILPQFITNKDTSPYPIEFGTAPHELSDTISKNTKVLGLMIGRRYGQEPTSAVVKVHVKPKHHVDRFRRYAQKELSSTSIRQDAFTNQLQSFAKKLISIYKAENLLDRLLINNLFVKEYISAPAPLAAASVFHTLIDYAADLFKDARGTNEIENQSINIFFQKKTKTIKLKSLK